MGGGEVEVGVGVAGAAGDGGGFATAFWGVVEGIAEGDCLAGGFMRDAGLMVFLEARRFAEGYPQPRCYGLKRGRDFLAGVGSS